MLGEILDDLLGRSVRALESAQVSYAMTGGAALVLSGRDRNTRDIDVLARISATQLEALRAACLAEGFLPPQEKDTLALDGVTIYRFWLPLEDLDMVLSLDVQHGQMPYHEQVLDRARRLRLGSMTIPVATVEDLILLKLLAFRPIDRADCIHMLRLYPDLDQEYLQMWVQRLAVGDRWGEVSSYE